MSKFDSTYDNIISESYHRQFGLLWTESAAKKSIENMLKKGFNVEDILADFDDFLVPKKWFSFKKLFSSKPKIQIDSFSGKNCKIIATYSKDLSDDEMNSLVYGKDDKKKKIGGIIYNEALTPQLADFGFEIPSDTKGTNKESNDEDNNSELDESVNTTFNNIIIEESGSKPKKINVVFNFTKVNYIKNIKPRQMKNPNYIESFSGSVYLGFDDSEDKLIKLGTITYAQSRYANMNPPKPIKDQIRDMWNKPNKDFGMWGTLAQKGMQAAANGIFGGLFSQTVQEENLDIKLEEKFQYNNNQPGGDLEKRASSIETAKSILQKEFDKKYSTTNAGFTISSAGDNKFKIIFKVNDVGIFKLDVEQS